MYFELTDNQRYDLESNGWDGGGYIEEHDGHLMYFIEDGLCSLIQATYIKVPVRTAEAEKTEDNLAFCCSIQDADGLYHIQQALADPEITAAAFGTERGTYDPLYIRYDQPSFRTGGQWFRIQGRDPQTGRMVKGSGV